MCYPHTDDFMCDRKKHLRESVGYRRELIGYEKELVRYKRELIGYEKELVCCFGASLECQFKRHHGAISLLSEQVLSWGHCMSFMDARCVERLLHIQYDS